MPRFVKCSMVLVGGSLENQRQGWDIHEGLTNMASCLWITVPSGGSPQKKVASDPKRTRCRMQAAMPLGKGRSVVLLGPGQSIFDFPRDGRVRRSSLTLWWRVGPATDPFGRVRHWHQRATTSLLRAGHRPCPGRKRHAERSLCGRATGGRGRRHWLPESASRAAKGGTRSVAIAIVGGDRPCAVHHRLNLRPKADIAPSRQPSAM